MRRYKLSIFLSQTLKGMWRNGVITLATIFVLFSCLLVTGCFFLLLVNIRQGLDQVDDLNKVYVFVDREASCQENEKVLLARLDEPGFLGWSTDPDAAEAQYKPGAKYVMSTDDAVGNTVTMYAIWENPASSKNIRIVYHMAGQEIVGDYPADSTLYKKADKATLSDAPEMRFSSVEFTGWSLTPSAEKPLKPGAAYVVDPADAHGGVITFYACYKSTTAPESYRVQYSANGYDVAVPTQTEVERRDVETQLNGFQGVSEITYISREETLENEKKNYENYPGLLSLLDGITDDDNPYPDTYLLTCNDNDAVNTIEKSLDDMKTTGEIFDYKCRLDLAEKISGLKTGIIAVFTGFMLVLLVVSILEIINTIRVGMLSRKDTIYIMRLIGATEGYISFPFQLEGIFIGLISGVGSYFAVKLGYRTICKSAGVLQMFNPLPFSDVSSRLLLGMLLMGALTGWIGSLISTRKYLRR